MAARSVSRSRPPMGRFTSSAKPSSSVAKSCYQTQDFVDNLHPLYDSVNRLAARPEVLAKLSAKYSAPDFTLTSISVVPWQPESKLPPYPVILWNFFKGDFHKFDEKQFCDDMQSLSGISLAVVHKKKGSVWLWTKVLDLLYFKAWLEKLLELGSMLLEVMGKMLEWLFPAAGPPLAGSELACILVVILLLLIAGLSAAYICESFMQTPAGRKIAAAILGFTIGAVLSALFCMLIVLTCGLPMGPWIAVVSGLAGMFFGIVLCICA